MLKEFAAALQKGSNRGKLPVKAAVRRAIGKSAGDVVQVRLDERIS
jgi:Domain of unknown function (DUF1905)